MPYEALLKDPSLPVAGSTTSYWQIPPHKKLLGIQSSQLPSQSEIVIIGSGVSACSTVHELFAGGFKGKIVVLEAREICSGATGRNGGRIHVHAMQDYDKFRKRYGDAAAEKIVRFQMLHYPKVESVVKSLQPEHAKAAALRETTSVAAAFSEAKINDMRRMLANFEAAFPDWVGKWKIVGAEEAQKVLSRSALCTTHVAERLNIEIQNQKRNWRHDRHCWSHLALPTDHGGFC